VSPGRGACRLAAGLWFGVAAISSACAHRAAGPGDALAAFGGAVERHDYAAAYALTSNAFRARVPLAVFRAQLESGGGETQELAKQLRTDGARRAAHVEVTLDLDETVTLVDEDGTWRLDGAALDPWSQKTPRAALRSFIRALEQHRYDVVLRLCPTAHRVGLTVEVLRDYWEAPRKADENTQLLARLRTAVRAPIVETGDEARLPYGERAEVHFVREDGLWKIENPD
jgi:hypothetical protein